MKTIQSDSTEVTFTQVYQDVKGALSAIGDALKTGAEHVYEVLVRQQLVESITLLVIYAILTLIAGLSWKYSLRYFERARKEGGEDYGLILIIPSLTTIVLVGVLIETGSSCITGFVNPEYGAIQEIRKFIR